MIVSIVVFAAGRSLYTVKQPAGNVIVEVTKCVLVRSSHWTYTFSHILLISI